MGRPNMTWEEGCYFETVCLQIRKLLELVAFGGMIAHGVKYTKLREDFLKHNKAPNIVKHLDAAQPHWFPRHINLKIQGQHGAYDFAASALTRESWLDLYNNMGTVLHVGNPFAGKSAITLTQSVPDTLATIKRHMKTHHAMVDGSFALICDLGEDGERVQVYEAEQISSGS